MDYFLPMLGVGLVTSVHCVSMCGPLVLTYAVKGGETGTWYQRIRPHAAYQTAKIASYTLVGVALGTLGAAVDIGGVRGWVSAVAGLFMILLGLNMTGWFPWLRHLTLKPPKFLVDALKNTRKKANSEAAEGRSSLSTPITFGVLTGFMPCGPLQAAQLAAAGAASASLGALTMLGFGLGTAPLMLVFGTVSGLLSVKFRSRMALVGAIVIIVLGSVMLNRGLMIVGSPVTAQTITQAVVGAPATTATGEYARGADGVVEVPLLIENVRYVPSVLELSEGEPARIVVDRRESNVCSDELWIPQLGVRQRLEPFGVTIVEVPASNAGTYSMTCQMGMMAGTVIVGVGGAGATSPVVLLLGALALAGGGLAYALRKQGGRVAAGACPAPGAKADKKGTGGRATPEPTAPRVLGFTPQEAVVIAAVFIAAIIAGLAFGGMFSS